MSFSRKVRTLFVRIFDEHEKINHLSSFVSKYEVQNHIFQSPEMIKLLPVV